MCFGIEYPML